MTKSYKPTDVYILIESILKQTNHVADFNTINNIVEILASMSTQTSAEAVHDIVDTELPKLIVPNKRFNGALNVGQKLEIEIETKYGNSTMPVEVFAHFGHNKYILKNENTFISGLHLNGNLRLSKNLLPLDEFNTLCDYIFKSK